MPLNLKVESTEFEADAAVSEGHSCGNGRKDAETIQREKDKISER